MSKISYPQLVKNLADAYRTAIGSTEPIVIGELTSKITEAMNSGGVSVEYKSITYNEDSTITLIDNDDIEHTMVCIYEDGKIIYIAYDGELIDLSYDDENLIAVGTTSIDITNVPTSSNDSSGGTDESSKVAQLNIAYGDTPPEETDKLWVQTDVNNVSKVIFSNNFKGGETYSISDTIVRQNPQYYSGVCRVGNYIYFFGGSYTTDIVKYNITENIWTTLTLKMPEEKSYIQAVAVGTDIYLIGGTGNTGANVDTMYKFNTLTDELELLEVTMSIKNAMMGVKEKKIYIVGGYYGEQYVRYFDTETMSFQTLSSTRTHTSHSSGYGIVDDYMYLLGGRLKGTSTYYDTISKINLSTGIETILSVTLPQKMEILSSVTIGKYIYLFGGTYYDKGRFYYNSILKFDTTSETLTTLNQSANTTLEYAISYGKQAYIFGEQKTVAFFNVQSELQQGTLQLQTTMNPDGAFNVFDVSTVDLYVDVDGAYLGNAENYADEVPAYIYKDEEWESING